MFGPAARLMNCLTYPKKFALLGIVVALVILTMTYQMFEHLDRSIQATEKERIGVAYVKPVRSIVEIMQRHRGLSSRYLNGDASAKEKILDEQRQLEGAIKVLDAVDAKHGKTLDTTAKWSGLRVKWADLKNRVFTLSPKDSFTQHTALIAEFIGLIDHTADTSGMLFDPDADSYYLIDAAINKLPIVSERAGQLRATGAGILASKQTTEEQKSQTIALLVLIKNADTGIKDDIEKAIKTNPALKQPLGTLPKNLETAVSAMIELANTKILTGNFDITPAEFFDRATVAIGSSYKVFDVALNELDHLLAARIEKQRQQLYLNLGIVLAGVLIMIYLFVGMYRSVISAINNLSQGASSIAGGDLTGQIRLDSRDELVKVADSFNQMATVFNTLIREIQAGSQALSNAAGELTDTSGQVAVSSNQQSEAASAMAAAVEQMTVSIDQVSENANEAKTVSRKSGELSEQGGEVIQSAATEMTQIADTVKASAQIVEELGQQSNKISTIIKVIKEIAEQTNLLALNAAIEAARAGEQGRGFAVVADEVRKLAERTTKSAQEIAEMIGEIQSGTRRAVASMEEGVAQVNTGAALATQAGDSITQIRAGSLRVVEMVNTISDALKEQSAASSDIARHVEQIAQMSEENSSAVHQTADSARHLSELAASLQEASSRFKV